MSLFKRTAVLLAFAVAAFLDILAYWSYHQYDGARREIDPARKIVLLERANAWLPFNDLVPYELGKSYLEQGMGEVEDLSASEGDLRKSVRHLKKSVAMNPASPFAHFYLAQALANLDLLSAGEGTQAGNELRKAALLAGEDSEIFFDVSRLFLGRWSELSPSDKDFTLGLLREILSKKDTERFALILSTWELNSRDYQIMDKILPEGSQIFRQYAAFLGEKSLSLDERHRYLARAEGLDFEAARSEFQAGESELYRFRSREARDHFERARSLLGGIRFYRPPSSAGSLVDRAESRRLLKLISLDLVKSRLEDGESLQGVSGEIARFLSYEEQPEGAAALERYLVNKGLIPAQLDQDSRDFDLLALQLQLVFKQRRFDEINGFARRMAQDLTMVVPPEQKRSYWSVLRIAGDSLQEAGSPAEAEDFYQKALQIEPTSLDTWLAVRRVGRRMQDEKLLSQADAEVKKLVTPPTLDLMNTQLAKGKVFEKPLFFDGGKIVLDIHFESAENEVTPLLAVALENELILDDYVQTGLITAVLDTEPGGNMLEITPLNGPIILTEVSYRSAGDPEDSRQKTAGRH